MVFFFVVNLQEYPDLQFLLFPLAVQSTSTVQKLMFWRWCTGGAGGGEGGEQKGNAFRKLWRNA